MNHSRQKPFGVRFDEALRAARRNVDRLYKERRDGRRFRQEYDLRGPFERDGKRGG